MAPISNASISDMTKRVKDAFSTPESTLRTIKEGKDPVKVIKENSQIINNPDESLVVSESQVTKGSVVEALNKSDDLSAKGKVKQENVEGKEPNTIPGDVLKGQNDIPQVV